MKTKYLGLRKPTKEEQKNADKYGTYSVLNVLAWLCVEQLAFEFDN